VADPVERLFYLRILDRPDQAVREANVLLADPDQLRDPWRLLLLTAENLFSIGDWIGAAQLQARAWEHAHSRQRQARTLEGMGRRLLGYGDVHAAAAFFEVANSLTGADGRVDDCSTVGMSWVQSRLEFDAIILSGGAARRFGGSDKPELRVNGWPLLDHVLAAVSGAHTRIVVGPERTGLGNPEFCREEPPGSGPVAGVAAALDRVRQPLVVLLAADLPLVGPMIDELRSFMTVISRDAAVLTDVSGRDNYLAAMWRRTSLADALARVGNPAGAAMRELYQGADVAHVPDFDAAGMDCDTPEELARAEERVRRLRPEQRATMPLAWPGLVRPFPS
jgi:molybdopterin-guanine dinucleotide biosynthesis protein A